MCRTAPRSAVLLIREVPDRWAGFPAASREPRRRAASSALGPEGQVSGTETIQHLEGCLYEGNLQAKGPAGAFTVKSTMVYDPAAHYLVILETADSVMAPAQEAYGRFLKTIRVD